MDRNQLIESYKKRVKDHDTLEVKVKEKRLENKAFKDDFDKTEQAIQAFQSVGH